MSKKRQAKHLKKIEKEPFQRPKHLGVYFIILSVVVVIAAILIGWDKFTVREIKVEGLEKINYLEVIHLSGIEYMSNIFTININEVEGNIEQNPVLDVMDVKKKFPSTITITVVERNPIAVLKSVDKYIVVDKDLFALGVQESTAVPGNSEIVGTSVTEYQLGEEVVLEKEIHVKKLKILLAALDETDTGQLIDSIDIAFTENIKMYSKAGYEIQIGSVDNIDSKCDWIKTMIAKLVEDGEQGGTLYITNVNTAHYITPNGN